MGDLPRSTTHDETLAEESSQSSLQHRTGRTALVHHALCMVCAPSSAAAPAHGLKSRASEHSPCYQSRAVDVLTPQRFMVIHHPPHLTPYTPLFLFMLLVIPLPPSVPYFPTLPSTNNHKAEQNLSLIHSCSQPPTACTASAMIHFGALHRRLHPCVRYGMEDGLAP